MCTLVPHVCINQLCAQPMRTRTSRARSSDILRQAWGHVHAGTSPVDTAATRTCSMYYAMFALFSHRRRQRATTTTTTTAAIRIIIISSKSRNLRQTPRSARWAQIFSIPNLHYLRMLSGVQHLQHMQRNSAKKTHTHTHNATSLTLEQNVVF